MTLKIYTGPTGALDDAECIVNYAHELATKQSVSESLTDLLFSVGL